MNLSEKIWTEEEIKKWANTSMVTKVDGYLIVQHYQDKLFHYFSTNVTGKYWSYKMNSVVLHSVEEQNG